MPIRSVRLSRLIRHLALLGLAGGLLMVPASMSALTICGGACPDAEGSGRLLALEGPTGGGVEGDVIILEDAPPFDPFAIAIGFWVQLTAFILPSPFDSGIGIFPAQYALIQGLLSLERVCAILTGRSGGEIPESSGSIINAAPEPGTVLLMSLGLGAMALSRRAQTRRARRA